ncbi:MAG: cytochrome c [Thermodesulfobacteriota bacterium]
MERTTRAAWQKPLACLACAGWVWALGPASSSAHEAHHHGSAGAGQRHMVTMQALKERIPPELRAMAEPPVLPGAAAGEAASQAYARHCALCHGDEGRGDGPTAAGLAAPPADFRDPAHASFFTAGEQFWIITHGVPEFGMPGFGDALDETTRWGLVRHIGRWRPAPR